MLPALLFIAALADRPDRVLADFESPTYGAWTTTGDAFGPGPAKGALAGQMTVGSYEGGRLVNSFLRGDDTEGTLTSPEFPIDRKHIRFLIGGGRFPGETCIDLLVDGKVARTATGHDSEFLRAASWDVSDLQGKSATIRIMDRRKGGWGHILIDQIILADTVPPAPDERDALLTRAIASDKAASERAAKDPLRPTFHLLPPANWMNDPNGPIYHGGYYHMFYQHNPYGDDWGNMHWGHARSKDLATWEHLPIALWPSKSLGENHVFSGCATVNPKGQLMLFYTSIGPRKPEQWAAIPDGDDLIKWKKHPKNPILTEDLHGTTKVHEWRDPFIFRSESQTYMVLGGNLNASKGGHGVVNVYRAENDDLTEWKYLGVLFTHPDAAVKNVECPLFFPLGKKWVLITSQGRPVHWFVGSLDPNAMRFTPETRGEADAGSVYAPNVTTDANGQTLFWGWVQDFPKGRGWNGCLTLPRVLTVSEQNRLEFEPAPELFALREKILRRQANIGLRDREDDLQQLQGDALEIRATLNRGTSNVVGLKVRRSLNGNRAATIAFDGKSLDVAGTRIAVNSTGPDRTLELRVYVDHSVLEVYTPDGQVVTKVMAPEPADLGVSAFATQGSAKLQELTAWKLRSSWKPVE